MLIFSAVYKYVKIISLDLLKYEQDNEFRYM